MTISVVQTQASSGGTIIFPGPSTPGNTVFLVIIMYGDPNPTSSNVQFGSATVPGTTLIQHVADTSDCSHDIWMLPNCPSAQTVVSYDYNHNVDANFAYEVAGLGPSPLTDRSASAFIASGGASTIIGAGPTSPTRYPAEFAIGAVADFDGGISITSPSGWTCPASVDASHGWSGYQILSSSGATPSFAVTSAGHTEWTAGIVTVAPSSSSPLGKQHLPNFPAYIVTNSGWRNGHSW